MTEEILALQPSPPPASGIMKQRGIQVAVSLLVLAIGLTLRLGIATRGENFDVDSYRIVSDLAASGGSFYAETRRYNYGPLWAYILAGLRGIDRHFGFNGPCAFHVTVAAFLSAIDVALFVILATRYSIIAAWIFFLLPVSVLITGYHSQFDNLAVLLALMSWEIVRDAGVRKGTIRFLVSACVLGLSLVTKHIFIFFPLWIVLAPQFGKVGIRIRYALVSYVVFLGSFVPWIFDSRSLHGIFRNVFHYNSFYGNGLLFRLIDLVVPSRVVERALCGIPIFPGVRFFWLMAMLALGYLAQKRQFRLLPFVYVVSIVATSPSVADQYLAIPAVACALFYRSRAAWVYAGASFVFLLGSQYNVGSSLGLGWWGVLKTMAGFEYFQLQSWLLIFLACVLFPEVENWVVHLTSKFFTRCRSALQIGQAASDREGSPTEPAA